MDQTVWKVLGQAKNEITADGDLGPFEPEREEDGEANGAAADGNVHDEPNNDETVAEADGARALGRAVVAPASPEDTTSRTFEEGVIDGNLKRSAGGQEVGDD